MSEQLANNAESQLSAPIGSGDTTLTVLDATAFPGGGTFRIVLTNDATPAFRELCAVTAVSGTTFTVSRGTEGTTARAWPAGSYCTCVLTVAGMTAFVIQEASAGVSTPPNYTTASKDASAVAAGQPVATHSSGVGVVRANASTPGGAAVGLAVAGIGVGAAGQVQTSGPLQLPDWTAATGAATLLARAVYFLDAVAGGLSSLSPSSPGQLSQPVGVAVAPDTLDIRIAPPILL